MNSKLGTLALATTMLLACAIGSEAKRKDEAKSGPDGGTTSAAQAPTPAPSGTFEKPPAGQEEGQPPPDKELPDPETRPPATPIPDGGPADAGKSPPLPPGFFDAGTPEAGKATVMDAGKA